MTARKPWWDDLSTIRGKMRLGAIGVLGPIIAFSLLMREQALASIGILLITSAIWIEAGASLRGYHTRPTKIASEVTLLIGGMLVLWSEVVLWWLS